MIMNKTTTKKSKPYEDVVLFNKDVRVIDENGKIRLLKKSWIRVDKKELVDL